MDVEKVYNLYLFYLCIVVLCSKSLVTCHFYEINPFLVLVLLMFYLFFLKLTIFSRKLRKLKKRRKKSTEISKSWIKQIKENFNIGKYFFP